MPSTTMSSYGRVMATVNHHVHHRAMVSEHHPMTHHVVHGHRQSTDTGHQESSASFFPHHQEQLDDGKVIKEEPPSRSVTPTNNSIATRSEKAEELQDIISKSLDAESRSKVGNILQEVQVMSDVEKLFLYMQLPTSSTSFSGGTSLNGSSQPVTPTGSIKDSPRGGCILKPSPSSSATTTGKKAELEVAQTYAWIRTHLEEDASFSLPKQEVYDDYKIFCQASKFDALCVADFGKAMKQVFPGVKPRRLGQRGNSKYCYSGLKKKFSIDTRPPPRLDFLSSDQGMSRFDMLLSTVNTQEVVNMLQMATDDNASLDKTIGPPTIKEMQSLRSVFDLIMGWAESVTNIHFKSVGDFILHVLKSGAGLPGTGSCNNSRQSVSGNKHSRLVRCNSVAGPSFHNQQGNNLDMSSPENLASVKSLSSVGPANFRSKSFSNGSASSILSDDVSSSFVMSGTSSTHGLDPFTQDNNNSYQLKYKKIQPKQEMTSHFGLNHSHSLISNDSTSTTFDNFVVMSSAPATMASSPTDFSEVDSRKRRFSGFENASKTSFDAQLSLTEGDINHPSTNRKRRKLAPIQQQLVSLTETRPPILSSTSTDSGISESPFTQPFAQRQQQQDGNIVGGGGNHQGGTPFGDVATNDSSVVGVEGGSFGGDLDAAVNQSVLDRQQLSQLRKLLEQNLPHKLPKDLGVRPVGGAFDEGFGRDGASAQTYDPLISTGDVMVSGSAAGHFEDVTSDPSSHLSESPMTHSCRDSPVNQHGAMMVNLEGNYVFQPISHESPASLLSDSALLNESSPFEAAPVHSMAVNRSNSSSTGSSPTPILDSSVQSLNLSSGQSTFMSSIPPSPFISPQATPIPSNGRARNCSAPVGPQRNLLDTMASRARHASGPGRFLQGSPGYRPPFSRASSFSPMASNMTVFSASDNQYRPLNEFNGSMAAVDEGQQQHPQNATIQNLINERSRHHSSPFFSSTMSDPPEQPNHNSNNHHQAIPFNRSHSVPAYDTLDISSLLNTDSDNPSSAWTQATGTTSTTPSTGLVSRSDPTWGAQDLKVTLDDLRDCDNDFSRFAQELEDSQVVAGNPGDEDVVHRDDNDDHDEDDDVMFRD